MKSMTIGAVLLPRGSVGDDWWVSTCVILLVLVGGCRSSEQSKPKETSVSNVVVSEKEEDRQQRVFAEETLPVILQKLSASLQANGLPPCDETNVEWLEPYGVRIWRNAASVTPSKGEARMKPASDGYVIEIYWIPSWRSGWQTRFADHMNSDEDFEACEGGWGRPGIELGLNNDGLKDALKGIITQQLAEQERGMHPDDPRYWKYLEQAVQ